MILVKNNCGSCSYHFLRNNELLVFYPDGLLLLLIGLKNEFLGGDSFSPGLTATQWAIYLCLDFHIKPTDLFGNINCILFLNLPRGIDLLTGGLDEWRNVLALSGRPINVLALCIMYLILLLCLIWVLCY